MLVLKSLGGRLRLLDIPIHSTIYFILVFFDLRDVMRAKRWTALNSTTRIQRTYEEKPQVPFQSSHNYWPSGAKCWIYVMSSDQGRILLGRRTFSSPPLNQSS